MMVVVVERMFSVLIVFGFRVYPSNNSIFDGRRFIILKEHREACLSISKKIYREEGAAFCPLFVENPLHYNLGPFGAEAPRDRSYEQYYVQVEYWKFCVVRVDCSHGVSTP